MQKILDRLILLISYNSPLELYIGLVGVFVFCLLIFFLQGFTFKLIFKRFYANLIGLPIFIALTSFIFSLIALGVHQINILIICVSFFLSFIFSIYILKNYENEEKPSEDSLLAFSGNTFWTYKNAQCLLLLILVLIPLFYVFSIDHARVPSQYDNTTYQFMGDLLFRNHTYPVVDYAGYQLSFLPPPGFFVFDNAIRFLWNEPRSHMILLMLSLILTSILFARLGSLLFKNRLIEIFMAIAIFNRGLFWTYWEFNVLKIFSLISVLLFLIFFIQFYYSNSKKEIFYLICSQLFLAGGLLTHPEFTVYSLLGFWAILPIVFLFHLFKKDVIYLKKAFKFIGTLIIPMGCFLVWRLSISTPSYFAIAGIPVLHLHNFLFHMTGVIPIISVFIACPILFFYKKTRKIGLILSGVFLALIFFGYCQLFLHFIFPKIFILNPITEDVSSHATVISPLNFPHILALKIYSLWPVSIICTGWLFFYLWTKIKNIFLTTFVVLCAIPLLFFDMLYMYYNQPIIQKNEYLFLKSLRAVLPKDAIVVAPEEYYYFFSAWVGPILQRDCLMFRGDGFHARVLPNFNLPDELKYAYNTNNFDFFLKNFRSDKLVVLYNKPHLADALKLAKTKQWQVIAEDGSTFAFRYVGK